eukprot:scaffold310437_cov24-Tisochrysis_lutea.AAC.2
MLRNQKCRSDACASGERGGKRTPARGFADGEPHPHLSHAQRAAQHARNLQCRQVRPERQSVVRCLLEAGGILDTLRRAAQVDVHSHRLAHARARQRPLEARTPPRRCAQAHMKAARRWRTTRDQLSCSSHFGIGGLRRSQADIEPLGNQITARDRELGGCALANEPYP